MSSVEKRNKTSKKNKKDKKRSESEVLESVMDSIEMAGASLNFFEEESEVPTEEVEAAQPTLEEEPLQAASDDSVEAEALEAFPEVASEEESMEAAAEATEFEDLEGADAEAFEESDTDDLSDAETMDMLEEDEASTEFIEQKQAYSILESLLFSSDRPLGLATFKQVFKGTSYKTKDIKKALEELQSEYADPARGVSLEEVNGGWQLRTKVDNMDFLRKLAKARPFKLSGPALEVLAIIAYKQPMVKSEVDEIRGVESGHLVRALMEKGLVCFQGKSELPGKPMQYGTTRKFLEIFGLRNLRELPSLDEIDQLLPDGIGIEEEDEKLSDVTEKMAEEFTGTYSEGEDELVKIEETLGDIDTSSEFFEEEKRRQKEKRDRDRARDLREALDVGEEIEVKDQLWLERYEAKQSELAAAAEAEAQAQAEAEARASEETDEGETERAMAPDENGEAIESAIESLDSDEALIAPAASLSEELTQLSAASDVPEEVLAMDQAQEEQDLAEEQALAADAGMQGAETFDPFAEEEDELSQALAEDEDV